MKIKSHKITKLLSLFLCMATLMTLTGCALFEDVSEEEETVDPYAIVVHTIETLEDGKYYVKHGNDFYEIPTGDASFMDEYVLPFNGDTPLDKPSRSFFYRKDQSELLIPTMFKDDSIIYKTSKSISDDFSWERFLDGGYTLGIKNFYTSNSDKVCFTNKPANIANENTELTDTIPLARDADVLGEDEGVPVKEYVLNAIDGVPVTADMITGFSTLKNVDTANELTLDVYDGTNLIRVQQKADYRIYYGFECYWTKGYEYSTDGYAIIKVGDWLKSGYYKIGKSGLFRYVDQPYSESINLNSISYSDAFFDVQYNELRDTYSPVFLLNTDGTRYLYSTEDIQAEMERRKQEEERRRQVEYGQETAATGSAASEEYYYTDDAGNPIVSPDAQTGEMQGYDEYSEEYTDDFPEDASDGSDVGETPVEELQPSE